QEPPRKETNMIVPFLTVLAGAGLMYFLDPKRGKRRRALLRDQWVKLQTTTANQVTDGGNVLAENTANKARGVVAETARHFKSEDVDDETLVARVRSEMGRYVSHPGAIE